MHPLAAILLGFMLIIIGVTGLAWLFATTVNRQAAWDLIDEEHQLLIWEEEQRV